MSMAEGQAPIGGDFIRGGNNPKNTSINDVNGAVRDTFYTPCNPWSNSITFQVEYLFRTGLSTLYGTILLQASAEPTRYPITNASNNYATIATFTVANTGRWESFIYPIQGNPYTYYRLIYQGQTGQGISWGAYLLKR